MKSKRNAYITIPELARILQISRIAVFKKVKKGEIKAIRIGRNYAIAKESLDSLSGKVLNDRQKQEIDRAVKKTVTEYGQTLKLLSKD